MPGKIVAPQRSLAIRLSRSSSFTLRVRSLGSENALLRSSPRVRGRFMRGPSVQIIRLADNLSLGQLFAVKPFFATRERLLVLDFGHLSSRGFCARWTNKHLR